TSQLPDSFNGPLLANQFLSKADHLFHNEIRGPESFAIWQGHVYTSLSDGRIVEVTDNNIRTITLIDPNNLGLAECRKPHNAGRCGRPLGLKFDSIGNLYTVDPYHGLYSVNISTGAIRLIVDISKENGLGARFLDDLVVLEKHNGHRVFYMTDASTEWDLYDVAILVAEHDRSGRLLRYDSETKTVEVILDKLNFPNGLELTDDKSAILMCSFNSRAIYKYHITGENAGKLTTLVDRLPGEPDNIKRSRDPNHETYWIGLFTARNRHKPHWSMDTIANNGYLKRFAMRLQRMVGSTIETTGSLFSDDAMRSFGFDLKTGHLMNLDAAYYGMGIEIDSNGTIINSLHSPDGHTTGLSEVFESHRTGTDRHFYLGSFGNPYLGRLQLPNNVFSGSGRLGRPSPDTSEQVFPLQSTSNDANSSNHSREEL
ncbi:hypothetical protein BLOT_000505, partial [Blomia tropicalis]